MSLLSRFVLLAPVVVLGASSSAACNAKVATVLESDAGDAGGGGGASCTQDNDCYANPAISAARGRCTGGVCVCEPGIQMTANGKCGDPKPDAGTTPTNDCEPKGGTCVGPDATPPPTYKKAGPGQGSCANGDACWVPVSSPNVPVCYKDQDCNGDPSVSALWGSCFYGICMCNPGFTVQPNGKCHTPMPPDCATQGGTCRQPPPGSSGGTSAVCSPTELSSAPATNMSCGDFAPAECCNDAKSCKGPAREAAGAGWVPVDFTCCAPNDAAHAPICVNGFQQCPPQHTAVAKPGGCG